MIRRLAPVFNLLVQKEMELEYPSAKESVVKNEEDSIFASGEDSKNPQDIESEFITPDDNPVLPETFEKLADTLKLQGRLGEAASYYRKAIELRVQSNSADQTISMSNHLAEETTEYEPQDLDALSSSSPSQHDIQQLQSLNSHPDPEIFFEREGPTSLNSPNASSNNSMTESLAQPVRQADSLTLVLNNSEFLELNQQSRTTPDFGPIKVYLDQAEMYCSEKKWEQAIAACQEALNISPDTAAAYKLWGNILQRMGKTTDAMGYYAKALVIEPDFPEVYANLGSLYAKQELWKEAISYYQKAIALNPNFAGAYRNLAKIWHQLNQTQKQTQCLVYALNLDPSLGSAEEYYQLGNSLSEQGQIDEAVRFYRAAVDLKPDFLLACNKLADALERQGDWKSAVTYYRQVLDIRAEHVTERPQSSSTPNSQPPKTVTVESSKETRADVINVQRSIGKESPSRASSSPISKLENQTQQLLQASHAQPDSDSIRIALGDIYVKQENWDSAIEAYKAALRINPKLADVYLKLAKAFNQVGKKVEMAESFYRACELDVTLASGQQYLILGKTFLKQDKVDKAIVCYQHALQVEPNLVDAYRQLGDALKSQGKKDDAMAAYQKALSLQSDGEIEKKKS